MECSICYTEVDPSEMFHQGCRHEFCEECWKGYLGEQINSHRDRLVIFCPFPNCSQLVRKEFIINHTDPEIKETYQKMIEESEIHPVAGLIELYANLGHEDGSYSVATSSTTDYYHYECNIEADTGWGCSYRGLQTILNYLRRKGRSLTSPISGQSLTKEPTIYEIQEVLQLVDGEYFKPEHVGSSLWIGPQDIAPYLQFFGVENAHFTDELLFPGEEEPLVSLVGRLWEHFDPTGAAVSRGAAPQMQGGSPLVMTDGKKAYTVVGIRRKAGTSASDLSASEVLLMDPHFSEQVTFADYAQFIKDRQSNPDLQNVPEMPEREAHKKADDDSQPSEELDPELQEALGAAATGKNRIDPKGDSPELIQKRKLSMLAHSVKWTPALNLLSKANHWQIIWVPSS